MFSHNFASSNVAATGAFADTGNDDDVIHVDLNENVFNLFHNTHTNHNHNGTKQTEHTQSTRPQQSQQKN